jgi:hypothetical protein
VIAALERLGGLGVVETGESLGVSPQTVMRDWRLTRAWLMHALAGNDGTTYR